MLKNILIIFATAMLPISELRVAIPLGLTFFKLPWLMVFLVAIIGNLLPVFFLLWLWPFLEKYLLNRVAWLDRIFFWLFARTRKKFYYKHKRFGDLALVIFVAIPLPITGAWTGSLAAWLFGIPYWKAIRLSLAGILISGILVSIVTLGLTNLI